MLLGIVVGILIYAFGIPILNQITDLIYNFLELFKMKFILKNAKIQKEIQEITQECGDDFIQTNPIGFILPHNEEEEDIQLDE